MEQASVDAVLDGVGARLRAARERRGLRLADVSEQTGISVSILSRLESGHRRPGLDLLLPIARVYRMPLDDLVGAPPLGDPRIHPRPVRRGNQIYLPLTRQRDLGVQAFKVIMPGVRSGASISQGVHAGYEWLYVLSGVLHLVLDGELTELGEGEAAEFDTRVPHGMASGTGEPVEFLALLSPQGERIHVRGE